jgi:hypothetical protein
MQGDKNIVVKHVFDPSSQTTVQHSEEVDCLGYESALLMVNVGAMAGSSTLAVAVNESDTEEGTPAAVALAVMAKTQAGGDASKTFVGSILLKGRKRWLQVDITPAVGAVVFSADLILFGAKSRPVSQDNTLEFSV